MSHWGTLCSSGIMSYDDFPSSNSRISTKSRYPGPKSNCTAVSQYHRENNIHESNIKSSRQQRAGWARSEDWVGPTLAMLHLIDINVFFFPEKGTLQMFSCL